MYYAYINNSNAVENIIVCEEKDFMNLMSTIPVGIYTGKWVKVTEETGKPTRTGFYHPTKNKFYGRQPYPSWTLDEDVVEWKAPKEKPEGNYLWNEEKLDWFEFDVNCPECSL